jgi:hypothetical protein
MEERNGAAVVYTNQIVCCFLQQASTIVGRPQGIKNVKLFVEHVDATHNPVMVFHNRKVKLQRNGGKPRFDHYR